MNSLRPSPDWGPAVEENRIEYKKSLCIVPSNFPQNRLEELNLLKASEEVSTQNEAIL